MTDLERDPARAVELCLAAHHIGLGLSYTAADWPEDYVTWDTASLLPTVPARLPAEDRRAFLAWLSGRGPIDPAWHLEPWG